MSDWLSVVIVAKKNTSLRLLNTLESVLNQDYSPIKIIVVDANEQNSIYSLGLQEDLSSYPQVEYLKLEHSLSEAEIRNHLLDSIEGGYIAFLNANDTWDLSMASTSIRQLKEKPETVATCSGGVLIDERRTNAPLEHMIEKVVNDPSQWILHTPVKMSAQVIYITEAVKRTGGFDEQFVHLCDIDMLLRLSKSNKVLITITSLCECRITPSQIDYEWNRYLDNKKFRIKYLDLFIVNRKLSQEFYGRMLILARANYMWLDCILYIVMYFAKAPLRAMTILISKFSRIIRYSIQWLRREWSILYEGLRIPIMLGFLILKGEHYKSKYKKLKIVTRKSKEESAAFLTARQYNEQSPLEYVFRHRLRSVVIPVYVTTIKKGMFYGCDNLIRIEIPNTVQEIQAHAFHGCINLRQVIIQEESRLSKIGDYAFTGCCSLEMINLPPSITQLGAYSFAECYSLKQLVFRNSMDGERQSSSTFPATIEKIPRYAFAGCKNLLSVEFEMNSMLEVIEEGAFLGCNNLQKIVLTGRLKSLGAYALAYCYKLETAAFLQIDTLLSIGTGAFMYCEELPYFQVPSQLERIRARTFYGCTKLKFIKIPKRVLSINQQAFQKCPLLSDVIILSGDVIISPTAFDVHTRIKMQENGK